MKKRWAAAAISVVAAALFLGTRGQPYSGPVSDHFDGKRFFLPGKPDPKTFGDFLRWQSTRDKGDWPGWIENTATDVPPKRVEGDALRVSFVGHATILLQTQGLNILTDPVWSKRASPVQWAGPARVNAPGIAFDKLPPIDIVLVSHSHYDHMDAGTIRQLVDAHNPRFITPLGNDALIRGFAAKARVEAYDWSDSIALKPGVALHLEPMHHWTARGLLDRNTTLWATFVLTAPGGPTAFVGDSGYGDGDYFRAYASKFGPFRFAILPIGAYEPRWFMAYSHMNPAEAVAAKLDMQAQSTLAHHWGTFQLTDETHQAPMTALAAALNARGLTPDDFRALTPGQVWDVPALAISSSSTSN
jgi:L-ascorbate metabolism protein UlaG (beta-lactamase superfamily)